MIKRDGLWEITPAGKEALEKYLTSDELGEAARVAYSAWRKSRGATESINEDDVADGVVRAEQLSSFSLEDAKERNRGALEAKLMSLGPYELQDMVAALLRAMGYYVPYVAKPGRDRGLDLVAYRDPLGAELPRIKIQVKHRDAIGRPEIEKFVGTIRANDIGIYVSSGGFTQEARSEARTHRTHDLTLIDAQDLIALWTEHYAKLQERDKRYLPLEVVHFLAETSDDH
jgi:restriction system protein